MNMLFYDYYERNGEKNGNVESMSAEDLANAFILLVEHIHTDGNEEEELNIAKLIEGAFSMELEKQSSSYTFLTAANYKGPKIPTKFKKAHFAKNIPARRSQSSDEERKPSSRTISRAKSIVTPTSSSSLSSTLPPRPHTSVSQTKSKEKSKKMSQDDILTKVLKAIQKAKVELSVTLLCKLLKGYTYYCKPKLHTSRLKRFAKLDAAHPLLFALKNRLSDYKAPSLTKISAVDSLSMLIFYICSKDGKLGMKSRLSGILPSFGKALVGVDCLHVTLNLVVLICKILKSPRNSQQVGRENHFIDDMMRSLRHVYDHSPSALDPQLENAKIARFLEIIYILSKNRRNKNQFVDIGCIQITKDLFEKYFKKQLDDVKGNTLLLQIVYQEICLLLVATIRIFAKTRKSKDILNELNILSMCERVLTEIDLQLLKINDVDESKILTTLQDSLSALCMRCLPNKQFPLRSDTPPPLKFDLPEHSEALPPPMRSQRSSSVALNHLERTPSSANHIISPPVSDSRAKRRSKAISECQNYSVKRDAAILGVYGRDTENDFHDESNDSFSFNVTAESDSDDDHVDEEDEGLILSVEPTSFNGSSMEEMLPSDFDDESPADEKVPEQKHKLVTKTNSHKGKGSKNDSKEKCDDESQLKCSLQTYAELKTNYSKYFKEFGTDNKANPEIVKNGMLYSKQIEDSCHKTNSVAKFVKIAYPEYFDPDVLHHRDENLLSNRDAMKQMIRKTLKDHNCESLPNKEADKTFPRLVYDLDYLIQKDTKSDRLTNTDLHDIVYPPTKKTNNLTFESRFESGNLRKAYQMNDDYYQFIISPDINQKSQHYQWFYFHVASMEPKKEYVFEIINCLKSTSMFSHGMQPVFFSVKDSANGKGGWRRCGYNVSYYRNLYTSSVKENESGETSTTKFFYSIRFSIKFDHPNDICYLAYHFPYTYSYLQCTLERWLSGKSENVFFRQDVFAQTLSSNALPLLTISAEPMDASREVVIFSARVHPGESNSSWIMHGLIKFLMDGESVKASELRERFIFKIIPMLNPDGVINGSHRCSLSGNDLNRTWDAPSKILHPETYNSKGLMQYCTDVLERMPFVFVDLHGHSRKSNVFVFGNNPEESWLQNDSSRPKDQFMLLPEILEMTAPAFSIKDSKFNICKSKESSARIAIWRQLKIERSYTMESTYCGFDTKKYKGKQINIGHLTEMGSKLCLSLLLLQR